VGSTPNVRLQKYRSGSQEGYGGRNGTDDGCCSYYDDV
jgi:hypothetical protein